MTIHPDDDVARNIRNEMQRDAMPSADEIEHMQQQHDMRMAQFESIEGFCEEHDIPVRHGQVTLLAQYFDFPELAGLSNSQWRGMARSPDFPNRPRPNDYEDIVNDHRRIIEESGPICIEYVDKIMNPFGGKRAVAMVIYRPASNELLSYTNDVWDRVMDPARWSNRFSTDTIERYQDELKDRLEKAVWAVGDDE